MSQNLVINYGSEKIEAILHFTERKTLKINVHPDLQVEIYAPLGTSIEKINAKIMKRAYWVLRQQQFFKSFLPRETCREYITGESHLYLGKRYRLKCTPTQGKNYVKFKSGYIFLYLNNAGSKREAKSLLEQWYFERASIKFSERLEHCFEQVSSHISHKPILRIKYMQKRWGSCSLNGIIRLNYELIKSPTSCIDYVIFHELCHLRYKLHDKSFFTLLEKFLPNWRDEKMKLEKFLS